MHKFLKLIYISCIFILNISYASINLTPEEKAFLSNKKVLTVQNLSTFPPFNFNENKIPKGYTIDYMKLLGKKLNIEIKFVNAKSWKDYLDMIKKGELDIIPHLAITEERKKYIDYTSFYHIEYETGIASKKNQNYKSMDDLKGKVIAVINKSFLHRHLKNNFSNQNLLLTKSTGDSLDILVSDRADVIIGSLPTLNYYIQKAWLNNIKTQKIEKLKLKSNTKLPMAVLKGNILLKSILEKANSSLTFNEVSKLKKKWLEIGTASNIENVLSPKELAYLHNKKNIKICVLPKAIPLEQIDKNGKHKGAGADILKIIEKRINKKFILVKTKNWGESLTYIKERKCDLLPMAINIPSRREFVNFTKPYINEPYVVATKSDKLFVKSIKDLSNKKIGIIKNYALIKILKDINPLMKIIEVNDTQDGLEKVREGKLFGFIDILPSIGYFIQKNGLIDLKIAGKLSHTMPLSMAIRNDQPILTSIMQKALDSISTEEITNIVSKWIEIKVKEEFDYEKLFYITLIFIFIFIFILLNNRSIKKINKKLEQANTQIIERQKMVDKYVQILTTSLKGRITSANSAYCKCIGYTEKELIQNSFLKLRHPDVTNDFYKKLWKKLLLKNYWSGEIKNLSKNGDTIYLFIVIEPLYVDNKKIGYRCISQDITDKKRIEQLSITDKLTGVYNRFKIDEILEEQIDLYLRYKTVFSLILIDLDDFKKVNDSYGHDIGDYVLKEVANLLRNNIRNTDKLSRWGGEEFLIITPLSKVENAYKLANNLKNLISKHNFKKIEKQTISVGVTQFYKNDTSNSLFKRVDECLYKAKDNGKNQVIKE